MYCAKTLSDQALSLAPDLILLLQQPRIPVSFVAQQQPFNLFAIQETLKSLLQHHSSKASIDYLKMGRKSTLHFKWNTQDCHFLMTHEAPGYLARLRLGNLYGHCTGV